ncbi:MAG: hypothetical protein CME65_10635 [Halobacteriovoraceae bacterium]|nr:hypothetical protein [Halobacteriovoraceae bacterium]|tara:strand:+ start:5048 stop:5869 length:822 start_codon:yes stop_codon:yes gene_type:complete
MHKLSLILFLLTVVGSQAIAMPKSFEVWFLSEMSTAQVNNILDRLNPHLKNGPLYSQRPLQCQPMGDYCFDPQVGLYKRGEESGQELEKVDQSSVEDAKKYDFMEVHAGHERQMIDCDESQLFDIFCGEAQKKMKVGESKLEIWMDVSSTMKQIDFYGFENECKRERFLRDLSATCPLNQKMKVYYFEEFRKEAGAFDRVCLSSGLNNMKRIMQDLDRSKAETVIIITDIFEAKDEFISAIEATNRGTIRGLNKPLYNTDLKSQLKRIRKFCL